MKTNKIAVNDARKTSMSPIGMVVSNLVTECEKQTKKTVHDLTNKGMDPTVYLYYRPSTDTEHGVLLTVPTEETVPEGYLLATGEGLRGNVPYSEYWAWIHKRCQRLPILAANF